MTHINSWSSFAIFAPSASARESCFSTVSPSDTCKSHGVSNTIPASRVSCAAAPPPSSSSGSSRTRVSPFAYSISSVLETVSGFLCRLMMSNLSSCRWDQHVCASTQPHAKELLTFSRGTGLALSRVRHANRVASGSLRRYRPAATCQVPRSHRPEDFARQCSGLESAGGGPG